MNKRIAIVGAGMGGLTAACLLSDLGYEITVFDQFDRPAPVGSGLVIQPVGQHVLAQIGALDDAMALGQTITRMLGHEARKMRRVLDVHYDVAGGPNFGLAIHRASLFDALLKAAQRRKVSVTTNARITATQAGVLTTSQGASYGQFDLVIDAAGAGSPLSPLAARPLAYGAVWGTVNWPKTNLPIDQLRQRYHRAERMAGVLPVGRLPQGATPKATIFWSLPVGKLDNWRNTDLAAWQDEARTLWPEFTPFVEQITNLEQMTPARYSHGTLRKPYGDRLVHIGDAAHRASPQLGQGANMALLDAAALAKALRSYDLTQAPYRYARARRLHVGTYQLMSAVFTPQYQSDSHILPALRDNLLFPLSMIPPLPKLLTAIVRGTMVSPFRGL